MNFLLVGVLLLANGYEAVSGMTTGSVGLDIIKHYEGLELHAYKDSVGVWTIGYGHTKGVYPGQTITKEQAENFLRDDVKWAESAVNRLVHAPLNQNQFDALVSWTFNLGSGNLASSTMLKRLNAYRFNDVPCEMIRWNRAGGKVLKGLVKRRRSEAILFNGGSFTC